MVTEFKPAVIAADLHLRKKPGAWSGRAEIAGDDIWGLEQVAKHAIEQDADLYLLGDVLDSQTNLPRPLVALQNSIGELARNGRVFFLEGQHDFSVGAHTNQEPWLSLISGATQISDRKFNFLGHMAYAKGYFSSAMENLELCKIPDDTEVLFMHGTIDLAMPMNYHFRAETLKRLKNLRYVFAGDWHRASVYHFDKVEVYYPGTTWYIATGEPRDKSVILVKHVDGKLEVSRLPLKTRPIYKLSELRNEETGALETSRVKEDSSLPKEIQHPIILIDEVAGPEVYEELVKHAHLYTTSAADPDVPVSNNGVLSDSELTNEQILVNYADKEKYPEQFAFTLDVIESTADQAIGRLKEKFGIKDADRKSEAIGSEVDLEAEDTTDEEELIDGDA